MPRYRCEADLPVSGRVSWIAEGGNQQEAERAFRLHYKIAEREERSKKTVSVTVSAIEGSHGEPVSSEASAAGPAPPTLAEPPAVAAPLATEAEPGVPTDPMLAELGITNRVDILAAAGLTTRSKLKAYYAEHGTFTHVRGIGAVEGANILNALKAWKQAHPEAD